jgi:RHS repeat-associated protein
VLGEYGSSAGDVKAEFIWMHPQVGESGIFGGDDGLGGYMPLAVAVPTATAGITELNWVHGNHMGVPIYYSDASGAQLATPTGYAIPGFPGQSRTFTDLYYNRYRDYESSTGRYVQADPIGLAGDVNPYLYALGNPLRYTDPSGLQAAVTAEKVIEVGFDWWWRRQLKPGRNTPWGRAWGAGEAIGAAIAVTRFIFNNCKDEGEDRARRCEENLDRDMLTCQALGKRGGKEAFRKCEEQAMLRYGNCLAGRDGPGKINAPLPPWSR